MNKLRNTLKSVRNLAEENLAKEHVEIRRNYDKGTKCRKFKPGNPVPAYLPIPFSSLKVTFCGHYQIHNNVLNYTYVISGPDRRKCTLINHVNSLKAFPLRDAGKGFWGSMVYLNLDTRAFGFIK